MMQNLVVSVKVNGQPSLSATCAVYLVISDNLAEVPQLKDMSHEENNSKLTSYLIIALVSVSTFFLTFIILTVAVRFCRRRKPRLLFDGAVAIPSAYFPPNYAEVEGAGTLRSSYNYDAYLTTGSRTSDFKFVRSYNDVTLAADQTLKRSPDEAREQEGGSEGESTASAPKTPSDWHFSQNQRPGTSGAGPCPEDSDIVTGTTPWPNPPTGTTPWPNPPTGTTPWPNPPTEAEQLHALMVAANDDATASLAHQFSLQNVPDYRQNVYIPGSTATLTANQQQPSHPALPQPPPQADAPKPVQTPASKKKSSKKDKK